VKNSLRDSIDEMRDDIPIDRISSSLAILDIYVARSRLDSLMKFSIGMVCGVRFIDFLTVGIYEPKRGRDLRIIRLHVDILGRIEISKHPDLPSSRVSYSYTCTSQVFPGRRRLKSEKIKIFHLRIPKVVC